MYLLAIDIGSTSIKSVIFDYEGNTVFKGSQKTEVFLKKEDNNDYAYWMPENIWESVCKTIKQSITKISDPKLIKSVSVTGFACDAVPIDREGNWLYPFISWHDKRCLEQLEWLAGKIDFEDVYIITGQKPKHNHTAFRNLWIKKYKPEIYKKIYKWLSLEDYINYRLCKVAATDPTIASMTLLLDLESLKWSKKMFDIFDLEMDQYPDLKKSGTFLGEVSKTAANDSGLACGTPVILGGVDAKCGFYAVSGVQQKNLVGIIGTYEHYHKYLDKPILKKEGFYSNIICTPNVIKEKYSIRCAFFSSGVYEWFRNTFYNERVSGSGEYDNNNWDNLERKAKESSIGSNGIFMLPDIFGSICPIQDYCSKGAFIGISDKARKEDFLRAVLEGLNYKGLEIYNVLKNYLDIDNDEKIIITGGAARNKLWMQIKADIFGKVLEVPLAEATALGAAMLGGIGIGVYKDFKDAFLKIKRYPEYFYPDERNHKTYINYFEKVYKRLYKTLKEINKVITNEVISNG